MDSVQCTEDELSICGVALRLTGQEGLARTLDVVLGTPLRLLLLVVLGLVARRLLHRVIDRLAERIATGGTVGRSADDADEEAGAADARPGVGVGASTRREQRARTVASVLRSVTTGVIASIVLVMALDILGFPVAPLLASAGIVGVALGFGCQTLVRDFLAGVFIVIEDQYGVGDVVDAGPATGTVEVVGLRVTRLRDVNGTVWYVRNGEILRVGNQSQGWSRAVLDLSVGYGEDVARVRQLFLDVANEMREDPDFGPLILEPPEVWGVEDLTPEAVVVRIVVKTRPLQQWAVARELRQRIKAQCDELGIEVPALPRAPAEPAREMPDDDTLIDAEARADSEVQAEAGSESGSGGTGR